MLPTITVPREVQMTKCPAAAGIQRRDQLEKMKHNTHSKMLANNIAIMKHAKKKGARS